MMRTWIAILLLSSLIAAPRATADQPDTLPADMGKYLVVLWESGTPVPGGKTKDGKEPDFAKLGGRLLYEKDNRRIILLPLAAARQLRKHESVAYLQRLWTEGESLKGWSESYPNDDRFTVQTDGSLTWGPKAYAYDGSGNITAAGGDHYTYDTGGRLIEAQVSGKTERYKYDSFGNLREKGVAGATPDVIAIESGTNRIEGAGYDVAGNVMTRGGRWEYEWDSAGMLWRIQKQTGSRRMLYDASDERIGTIIDSVLSRWQIRDVDGQIIREYKGDRSGDNLYWFWEQDHVRAGGQLVAGATQEWTFGGSMPTYGGERHYHLDHLGSVRLVTNHAGKSLSEHDYYPFGLAKTLTYQEQINLGDPHIDGMRFAGHWRDFLGLLNVENTEYLDYMHARYYDPRQGRFLSVDPVLGDPAEPQTWNRYAYARNSPLVFTDPTGEFVNLGALTADERNKLIAGLNDFTGNTYDVDPQTNYLRLVSVGQNSSATATTFVNGLIGSNNAYNVTATTKPGDSWYNVAQNRIELDFSSFDGADYNGIDPRTFNLGSTAIHEWKHQTTGLVDTPDGQRTTPTPQDTSWTGPIVDAVNVMRSERGLPTRAAYYSTPVRPPGFAGLLGIGQPRSGLRFFDPQRGRVVQVIRNVP
ncbi:MAG TPA: RHS repeat-associated core domain-containing protein [Thermoanaerobaculia bacterium]|nr:RHS repeat-associated core domain-containing protein [Thermoanaerobaculia bacterium]